MYCERSFDYDFTFNYWTRFALVCNANYRTNRCGICNPHDKQIYPTAVFLRRQRLWIRIITISREFESGGREFGRRLAEQLNIAYYDQEIIREISKRAKLAEQYIEQQQSIMTEQNKIIRDMAERSDCVIVGRCGNYILEQFHPYRIFIYAELEHRIKRCIERYTEHEKWSPSEMEKKILTVDRSRKKYYEYYTGKTWGNPLNYQLRNRTG